MDGVGQHAPGKDPDCGDVVRSGGRVAALANDTVRDVRVRADEVVGLDVLEGDAAVPVEPGADAGFAPRATHGLERLFQAQDEADRPAQLQGREHDRGLQLRVLLAAEAATRVRRVHADLGQRHAHDARDQLLEPVRVLDRAPDRQPVPVRGGHERVRLDGEVGDDREAVVLLDDDEAVLGRGGVHVAPRHKVLAEDVRLRQRVLPAERRVLHQRRVGGQRPGDREDRGQNLVLNVDERRGPLRQLARVGDDERHGLAVVLGLADGQDGAVLVLRPEPRHGLRQVIGRHHQVHAGQGERRGTVHRDDPRPRAVEGDELRVQRIRRRKVREVPLGAGDTFHPANARRRAADPVAAHRSPSATARIASVICW